MEGGVYTYRLWPDPLMENLETRKTCFPAVLLRALDWTVFLVA